MVTTAYFAIVTHAKGLNSKLVHVQYQCNFIDHKLEFLQMSLKQKVVKN